MKRIISMILFLTILISSTYVFAGSMTEEAFLELVISGSSEEVYNALTEYADALGINIDLFEQLSESKKEMVVQNVKGEVYDNLSDFQDRLDVEIKRVYKSSSSGSSGGGSSSGGGGGGSSSISPSVSVSYKTYSFAGKVSLPNNEVAESDIPVTISIKGKQASEVSLLSTSSSGSSSGAGGSSSGSTGYSLTSNKQIETVIPAGEKSITYKTTTVIANSYSYAYAEVRIESDVYLQYSESNIILLDEVSDNVLDVEISKPDCYISGIFTLGEESEVLPDDLDVQLYLSDSYEYNYKYSYSITLVAGEKEAEFSLPAKYGEYILTYYASAYSNSQQHISTNWVNYGGVIADTDVNGIVLECQYSDVIEGVVKLPDDMVAPKNGVMINIRAGSSIRAGRSITVAIPEGENSVNYTVADSEYVYITPDNKSYRTLRFKEIDLTREEASVVVLEPIYTVCGTITFSEPVKDNKTINMNIQCKEKGYDFISYINYNEGDVTIDYCIVFSEYISNVEIGDILDIGINRYVSDIYATYSETIENAITISDYISTYNLNIDLKRRAEIIKGTIHLPDNIDDAYLHIYADGDGKWFRDAFYISQESDKVEFVLKGDTETVSDYNGDYVLYINCDNYCGYSLYYNQGSLSLNGSSTVTVNGDTVELELTIPEENQIFEGTANLPQACSGDITVDVNLFEKDTHDFVGNRQFIIPAGETIKNFELGYLLKDGDYIVSYSMSGGDISPYYSNMELYVTENGVSEYMDDAKIYVADNNTKIINLEFEPLVCSSRIEGTLTIPFGITATSGTYFYVNVTANNGTREESIRVRFNAGETEKSYSISIPDLYRDSFWKISYIIGTPTSIPDSPARRVINDSSFKPKPTATAGGNHSQTYNRVPAEIIQGINVYHCQEGITYYENEAYPVSLSTITTYTADFVIGTIYTEHIRKIGGYFCAEDSNISVEIQLIDAVDGSVLDNVVLSSDFKYEFYELKANSLNDVLIKYSYNGKEYYYSNNGDLTEFIEDAKHISVQPNSASYVFDVNKDNIKYIDFNDRYFDYYVEGLKYPYCNLKISIFDLDGNVLYSIFSYNGYVEINTAEVFIGFEFGGEKYYFVGDPNQRRRQPTLSYFVDDIRKAQPYILPHKTYKTSVCIDLSDFIAGQAVGNNGEIIINESYFNYSETENGRIIESLYVDAADEMFSDNNTIHIAFYEDNGKLLGIKSITEKPEDNIVPLNVELPENGYIKILGWGLALKPLINTMEFFN